MKGYLHFLTKFDANSEPELEGVDDYRLTQKSACNLVDYYESCYPSIQQPLIVSSLCEVILLLAHL